MNNPPRHHYGTPTPNRPRLQDGKPHIKATLPDGLRGRIPNPSAVRSAIFAAPRASDLPEPPGKCIESYNLRIPLDLLDAFDAKRDGLARGAYLRRIIGWAFAPPSPPNDGGGGQ